MRWVFFLPVGLALHCIAGALIEALFGAAGLRAGRSTPNAVVVLAVTSFVSGVTFTLLAGRLSPRAVSS